MAFSISEFSSKLNKHGLARDNLFLVVIEPPLFLRPGNMSPGDLSFFCRSVSLPALTLGTTEVLNQGYGVAEKRPIALPHDNLNTVFMVDAGQKVTKFFHRWIQHVLNYDNSRGYNFEYNGMLPYEIDYKSAYSSRIEIYVYSTESKEIKYKYRFDNAFPVATGNIELAWDNNEAIMTLPVQFAYDVYVNTGIGLSTKSNRINDFFANLGTFGRALDDIGLDNPLQDVVDRFTLLDSNIRRINDTFDAVSNIFR